MTADGREGRMRAAFERIGWQHTQTYEQFGRASVHYAITRQQWEASLPSA